MVDFDRSKIEAAISKACVATNTAVEPAVISGITDRVIAGLEVVFVEKIPGVEDVQDIVEKKIADVGLFEVAKAYILYRREHAKIREEKKQEILTKIARSDLKVKKRDSSIADFDISQIELAVKNSAQGFEGINTQDIVDSAKLNIYDGISTSEINQAVIMAIKARIERDPSYSFFAARFLANDLYKDVLGRDEFGEDFNNLHAAGFARAVEYGIECGRLDKRLAEFDLEQISKALQPERDHLFEYMGVQTLYDRYFMRDPEQKIFETPQYFWMRVAMGLALTEKNKESWAIKFYDTISRMLYVPSTPTLLHSGTVRPQMSSCYLTTVEDDLHKFSRPSATMPSFPNGQVVLATTGLIFGQPTRLSRQ